MGLGFEQFGTNRLCHWHSVIAAARRGQNARCQRCLRSTPSLRWASCPRITFGSGREPGSDLPHIWHGAATSDNSHYRAQAASTSSAAASSRQIVGHMNRHFGEAQLARRLETGMADNYDPFAVPAARLRRCTSRTSACRGRRGRCGRGSGGP